MKNFYKITKFDYNNPLYEKSFLSIEEFKPTDKRHHLHEFFEEEDKFVKMYLEFCKYFHEELAVKIFYDENEIFDDIFYEGLPDNSKERMSKIIQMNFEYLNEEEKILLFRYHVRGICGVHLIHYRNMSFLKPMDDYFYAWLCLDDFYKLEEIFPKSQSLFFYVNLDHRNDSDDYELPENIGALVYGGIPT